MSKLASMTLKKLRTLFPHNNIKTEYYVSYRGKKYYFDFFIPELMVAIECHGAQHFKFTPYFHSDYDGFINQKRRDRFKDEYCTENNIALVCIKSEKELRDLPLRILKALMKVKNRKEL